MEIARFMATPLGRGIRVVVGLILMYFGFTGGGVGGFILGLIGVVMLIAGAANLCLLGPLLKAPLKGNELT